MAWGDNTFGQSDVPALPASLVYVEVAAGGTHTLARRSDGSVVAWGENSLGKCDVPALRAGLAYVEVAAGGVHTVARRSDGSVVAWGNNSFGQCDVPTLPAGLKYLLVATSGTGFAAHTAARRSDGSVVAWGDNAFGQCDVPALPTGLEYVEIAAGVTHTVARRSDNMVVAWGDNANGQLDVPTLPAGRAWVEVAAGWFRTVARTAPTSAWVDLGHVLAGLTGPPQLTGRGSLQPDTKATLLLTGAQPLAPAFFIVSTTASDLPYKGGTLVPTPEAVVPLQVDAAGELSLGIRVPLGLPPGTSFYMQEWILDPGGPEGFSASNALRATVP